MTKTTATPTFNHLENTKVFNGYFGWNAETKVKVNGKNWVINTMKRHNGTICTHCKVVQDEGGGSYSYMMFGDNNPKEDFWLNILPKGTKATEKTIRTAHFAALAEFDQKNENGELPSAEAEYKIEIGQVLFSHWPQGNYGESRRAIYEIISPNKFKTVYLDGSKTQYDEYVRNYKKVFGIGTYYREGDKISPEEVQNLLIEAHQNMKIQAAIDAEKAREAAAAAEKKAAYLAQFQKADRRTTTNIIKRHILKTWPEVLDVKIKTDVFSGGDSMDVEYTAVIRISELENFIDLFQDSEFNSYEDMSQQREGYERPILENHILQSYKYTFCKFTAATPEQLANKAERKELSTNEASEAGNVPMEIKESYHAKKQIPLWVVVLSVRVEREVYEQLNARAKQLGGYYSSYKGQGAIPGFTFKTKEAAEQFTNN